jgi:plasmid stabilization system protein ParE
MKLVFTLAARADLRSIGEFIAADNPRRAMTFIDELEQHCRTLAAKPRAHHGSERNSSTVRAGGNSWPSRSDQSSAANSRTSTAFCIVSSIVSPAVNTPGTSGKETP